MFDLHPIDWIYTETINSLHMLNPITYLGYVKRGDTAVAEIADMLVSNCKMNKYIQSVGDICQACGIKSAKAKSPKAWYFLAFGRLRRDPNQRPSA